MKYGLAALALVLVAGLLYGLHTKAVRDARLAGMTLATVECIKAIDKSINDAKKARQRVEDRNAKLSDDDLGVRLSRWVLDQDRNAVM